MADVTQVIIDAGHGGDEPGAVYEGRREKDDTLRLALAVGRLLEEQGIDVSYTRTTDVYDTPLEKAQIANQSGADYLISIHRNAMPVPGTGSGAMVLVYQDAKEAALLAENIQRRLAELGFADLGVIERPGLILLRRTEMPAVLVEAGFLDHPADNKLFDEAFEELAQAIADGVLETIRQQQAAAPQYYQVQTGAYRTRMPAERQVRELEAQGLPAFLVYRDGLYKVRVGAYQELEHAVQMEQTLRRMGYATILVQEART